MKRLIVCVILCIMVHSFTFSQDIERPTIMVELSAGYGMGVNLDNAGFFDIKFLYPFGRFGFALEGGGLFSADDNYFHAFLGPMFFIVNTNKWRIPLFLGGDIITSDSTYLGVGAILAVHYSLTKNIYIGFNFEVTYAMNHIYQEYVGDKITVTQFDDGSSKTQTVRQYENKNHYGNNWYFKPSISFGVQF